MQSNSLEKEIQSKIDFIKQFPEICDQKYMLQQQTYISKLVESAEVLYLALDKKTYDSKNQIARPLITMTKAKNDVHLTGYLFTSYEKAQRYAGKYIARLEKYPYHFCYIILAFLEGGIKRLIINAGDYYSYELPIYVFFNERGYDQRKPYDYTTNQSFSLGWYQLCLYSYEQITKLDQELIQKRDAYFSSNIINERKKYGKEINTIMGNIMEKIQKMKEENDSNE